MPENDRRPTADHEAAALGGVAPSVARLVDHAGEQRRAQLALDLRIVARRAARTNPELASLARAFANRLDRGGVS